MVNGHVSDGCQSKLIQAGREMSAKGCWSLFTSASSPSVGQLLLESPSTRGHISDCGSINPRILDI